MPSQLKPEQRRQIEAALLDGFDKAELKRMFSHGMGDRLENVADGKNLTETVHALVGWAERRGRLPELIEVAHRANPDNAQISTLYTAFEARTILPEPLIFSPPTETFIPAENPFTAALAIQDPARFIGRSAELRRLDQLLSGGSVSVTGEAKIGKSSLLWQLKHRWQGTVIGPIDCQQLIDPDDFYEELSAALGLEDSRWRTIRNALRDTPVLLLLDEMGAAPSRGLEARHMEPFRSLCDQNRNLHIVTASRRPLRDIFPTAAGSEFYNIFSPLMLGPLTKTEANELLSHPWTGTTLGFDVTTVDELMSLADTHPFRLQRAAFHRFEAMSDIAYNWHAKYKQDVEMML